MERQAELEALRKSCGPGHPWFYVLGGKPLYPRQILEAVERAEYRGYLAREIDRTDSLCEPRRSTVLRSMRTKALADYRADLSRYREVARDLYLHRAKRPCVESVHCGSVHESMSLKHNHLFNDLAHLRVLAQMLDRQRDLFDF